MGDVVPDVPRLSRIHDTVLPRRRTRSVPDDPHPAPFGVIDRHPVSASGPTTHPVLPAPDGVPAWQVQVRTPAASHTLTLHDLSHQPQQRAGGAAASGEVRAPFNGRVAALLVQPGQRVTRGDALLAIESMKIEHRISAPRDGVVEALAVATGQQVAPGQRLLLLSALP